VRIRRPSPTELAAVLEDVARRALAQAGIREEGVVRMLAARALPILVRALDWLEDETARASDGGCLGVELDGRAAVPLPGGGTAWIQFKADRVDRLDERLVLSDFKTGAPIKDLLQDMKQGKSLQPAAYLLGATGSPADVRGRLLYFRPDVPENDVKKELREENEEWRAPMGAAVQTLLGVWRTGAFFPRMTKPDGEKPNAACQHCDVSQACLREDSGARRRLVALARGYERSSELDALRALWNLGRENDEARTRGGRGRRR
jgi:hypothetical protein